MKKKQPTIKNIAEELGISFSTVSRALQDNSRISTKTKEKVWEVAKRIEYIPNPAAYFLKNNKTFAVGILIPSLHEPFFADVISGIENIIEVKGYHTIVIQSGERLEKEQKAVETFLRMRVDGLIVSISGETSQYTHFQKLESYGIPVVFFDRVPREEGYNKVKCNTKYGATLAIDFLHQKGYKKIAFINGPENLETAENRLSGYLEGLKKNNIQLDPTLITNCDLSVSDTADKFNELICLPEIPDAILTFNNFTAMYSMKTCRKNGLIPNKDIAFVNFGNFPLIEYMDNPPMASIEQFPKEMGNSAAKLLMDCLEDSTEKTINKEIMIQTKLIINNL
ncbi:MAG: LacI family DNA-binding transcriptional regulator [Bacteroidota bacterium]